MVKLFFIDKIFIKEILKICNKIILFDDIKIILFVFIIILKNKIDLKNENLIFLKKK